MSQTSALNLGGSYEVKMETISIGTGILEVCDGLNMSQTSALDLGGSKEVKMGLTDFGIEILEVWEGSQCVADQCFEFGRDL